MTRLGSILHLLIRITSPLSSTSMSALRKEIIALYSGVPLLSLKRNAMLDEWGGQQRPTYTMMGKIES